MCGPAFLTFVDAHIVRHAAAACWAKREDVKWLLDTQRSCMHGLRLRQIRGTIVTASILLWGTMSAFGQSADPLYEAAKKEGKIVYWTANDIAPTKAVAAEFQKKYPGIAFEQFQIQQGPAIERMTVEARSGHVGADLFDSALSYLEPALSRDLIAKYDWAAEGIDPKSVYYDNRCIDYYDVDQPISYNTNLVKAGEITGWDDLLQPKWRGKVIFEARGLGLAILSQAWGEVKVNAYIDALKANRPLIVEGNTPVVEALAGGQAALAIGLLRLRSSVTKEKQARPWIGWPPWVRFPPAIMFYACRKMRGIRMPRSCSLDGLSVKRGGLLFGAN